jgi:hypothetical protein
MGKTKTNDFAFEKSGRYYRTSGNYAPEEIFGGEYEQGDPVSMTVPDQSLTVQQLIERHRRGLGITGYRPPVYYNETLVPPIENMDFAEKRAFLEHIKEHRASIEAIFHQNQDASIKAKKDAEFQAAVDAEILKRSE